MLQDEQLFRLIGCIVGVLILAISVVAYTIILVHTG